MKTKEERAELKRWKKQLRDMHPPSWSWDDAILTIIILVVLLLIVKLFG